MLTVHMREFRVHARHIDRHHARIVTEASFEAAAVAYLDDWHAPGDGQVVSILVHELATGHEHCFQIDFETGEMTSCG